MLITNIEELLETISRCPWENKELGQLMSPLYPDYEQTKAAGLRLAKNLDFYLSDENNPGAHNLQNYFLKACDPDEPGNDNDSPFCIDGSQAGFRIVFKPSALESTFNVSLRDFVKTIALRFAAVPTAKPARMVDREIKEEFKFFGVVATPLQYQWCLDDAKDGAIFLKVPCLPAKVGPDKILDHYELALALFKEEANFRGHSVEIVNPVIKEPLFQTFLTLRVALEILQATKIWFEMVRPEDLKTIAYKVTPEKIRDSIAEVEKHLTLATSRISVPKDGGPKMELDMSQQFRR